MRTVAVLAFALLIQASGLQAQDRRLYIGGSVSAVTQTHADAERLGGTTWGWSGLVGVRVAPRLSIEFEPTFAGPYERAYSYRPGPSLLADVVASRSHTFFSTQARIRLPVIEPVVGASYVHARLHRVATFSNGRPYFEDTDSEHGVALVLGVDAAIRMAPHMHFVPTFRMFVSSTGEDAGFEKPIRFDTTTGAVSFRYGAGIRVSF